jgi:hypothetical protein
MEIESEEDDPRKMSLFALRRRRDKFRKTLDTYLSRADGRAQHGACAID